MGILFCDEGDGMPAYYNDTNNTAVKAGEGE